jgi:hypothetical protein
MVVGEPHDRDALFGPWSQEPKAAWWFGRLFCLLLGTVVGTVAARRSK